ncbi:hypothetical protein ASE41_05135 [Streptomyces sp. Root264]|nr:hypothetical protein ASE41_05135 [Streptomyces sp. Root264]
MRYGISRYSSTAVRASAKVLARRSLRTARWLRAYVRKAPKRAMKGTISAAVWAQVQPPSVACAAVKFERGPP